MPAGYATITTSFMLQPDSFVIISNSNGATLLSAFGTTIGSKLIFLHSIMMATNYTSVQKKETLYMLLNTHRAGIEIL